MENYKKVIKRRIFLLCIPMVIAIGLGVYNVFGASSDFKESYIFGFQCGVITAIALLSVIIIIKYRMLMKDEKKLKLEFNRENDERTKAIQAKAGLPMLLYTSIGIIICGIIMGYFDLTVFKTLITCGMAQMTVAVIVKMIYTKRM